MNHVDDRQLISALSELSVGAPDGLADQLLARWSYVEGPIEDAYVATTSEGISSVVPASTVRGDDGFAEAFHRYFGRPLERAVRPPDGVEDALRTGDATGLRFDLRGRTSFERSVLETTLQIPAGELRPYSWVAWHIDRPRAVRAVGTALGQNPVPLLIPCHRVVRSDGSVGQYGFGADMKRRLLDGEGVDVDQVESTVRRGAALVGDDLERVVCMPTCRWARPVGDDRRHGFRSLAEATAAGFRPCADCRPVGR
jgi:methylated-DNA-[protein]-cysteine S-methyltransferase